MFSTSLLLSLALAATAVKGQVTATGTMGVTNPPQATLGTAVNQTSYARLLSVNAYDDFCLFAPPENGADSLIGNTEAFEVAWCTKPRNNARVIPDGTLQAVHFVKTPLYVQVMGWGDFTKLNIPYGDQGGELDPHGATGEGNPVGGNVTSNVSGQDVHYEEWMNYMSYQQFCIRVCTSENSTYSAANECQHTLDEMGCNWVMPGDYTNNTFTSCEADSAYPPGWYPQANGSVSTFAQRYTGTYTDGAGSAQLFTVGQTVTPQTPYSTPASSNCQTYSTVSNGVTGLAAQAVVSGTASATSTSKASSAASTTATASGTSSATGTGTTSRAAAAVSSAAATSRSGAISNFGHASDSFGVLVGSGLSVLALVAGAGALLL